MRLLMNHYGLLANLNYVSIKGNEANKFKHYTQYPTPKDTHILPVNLVFAPETVSQVYQTNHAFSVLVACMRHIKWLMDAYICNMKNKDSAN